MVQCCIRFLSAFLPSFFHSLQTSNSDDFHKFKSFSIGGSLSAVGSHARAENFIPQVRRSAATPPSARAVLGRLSFLGAALLVLIASPRTLIAQTPATLISPAPGSTINSSNVTFTWNPGSGVTAYELSLGTNGPTGANLWESGSTTNLSATATIPQTGASSGGSSWGTMDAWLQCANPAASTTVTTSVLSSCTIGDTSGGFSLRENPLTPMQIAPSQGSLGAAVTVGGTAYAANTATQSLAYNHDYFLQYFNFNLPSTVNTQVLNMNGYITFAPPNTGADVDYYYDYVDAQDPTGYDAFVIQLHSGLYKGCTYCVFLETNPYWTTTHSSTGVPLTPGTRYAFSVQANEQTGVASLAIYDATTFQQVGSTITSPSMAGNNIANILVGNVELGTAPGYTSYLDNLMLDWSQHQSFPNIPHSSSNATVGTTVYATLFSMINGVWKPMVYTYQLGATSSGPGSATPSGSGSTLSDLSCISGSLTGPSTDWCMVSLPAAAAADTSVALSSSSSTVTLPPSVTVPAGSTSVSFEAHAATVNSDQAVTLSASASGSAKTFTINLVAFGPAVPILSVGGSSLSFGSGILNVVLTQTVTLTSSGGRALTISGLSVGGAGFSLPAVNLPVTLSPGQSLPVSVEFLPTLLGNDAGTLTITSNSSTGSTTTVSLSGSGSASSSNSTYQVDLAWNAPSESGVTIAGYKVYRADSGASSYELLNSSITSATSYVDGTVQGGATYDYYIESVDSSGAASAPSAVLGVTVP